MNNLEITKLLGSSSECRNIFGGVFPSDMLPTQDIKRPIAYIANTDPHYMDGSHWVALYRGVDNDNEYFCSYGQDIPSDLLKLQKLMEPNYITNPCRLQQFFSAVCGQHCIYYICCKARGMKMSDIVNTYASDCELNDELVNQFVETRFNVDLNVYDYEFLAKQICREFIK